MNYNSDEYQSVYTIYHHQTGKYLLTIRFKGFRIHSMNKLTTNMHYHHENEIIYVLAGKGLYTCGSKSTEILPGDVHLCHENIPHEIVSNPFEPLTYALFSFVLSERQPPCPEDYGDKIIDSYLENHRLHLHGQHQLLSFLELIDKHVTKQNEFIFVIRQAIVYMILEMLYLLAENPKPMESTGSGYMSAYQTATDYIEKNLSKKIYIQDIADACYISVRNLQLLFKKNAGKTVTYYINEKRMEMAKNYLRINTPIKDAAYLVGIDDLSRFSKLFKQYTGLTPSQYQKLNCENLE
jgi:AraC-like DNA-binding protein